MDGTILIADDDRTIRTVLTQAFTRAGCRVHATSSLTTLMRWVGEGKGDMVITDVMMPDGNGLEMLPAIEKARPGLPVIVISAQNTIMTAIRANEAEAFDYLPKPFDLPDLMQRAARALAQRPASMAAPAPIARDDLPLVGQSGAMQAVYRLIARLVNVDLAVLVSGESGVGKSLLARVIHNFSDRHAQPFVVANLADLRAHDGPERLLARAASGTLVFDEVADFDAEMQGRVLRMIDGQALAGPRIMATSQGDLAALMAAGTFRDDLYYRLNGVTLHLPPLRDRIEDIALLCTHFLAQAQDGAAQHLSAAALKLVQAYSWPGNLRQLENAMRQLQVTSAGAEIGSTGVAQVLQAQPAAGSVTQDWQSGRLADSIARHIQRYFDLHGDALPPPGLYVRILREMELPLLEIALQASGGNQAKCADLLGINRNTLRKKITDLDIRVTRRRKLM